MKPAQPSFTNVSDTARFVALLRAMESERPDAHFHDPYARVLGGDAEILKILKPTRRFDERVMAVRTQVIDELILKLVREQGIYTIVNLAAGLDARPYRLDLPASLVWYEADFAPILQYKEEKLRGAVPRCRVERVPIDLADPRARNEWFRTVNAATSRALIVTEGLLMYLKPNDVTALARDLYRQPGFHFWLMDVLPPSDVRWLNRKFGKYFDAANASVHFGPEEGYGYFAPLGWKKVESYSFAVEAARLHRERPSLKALRYAEAFLPPRLRPRPRRYGCALLRRAT
jgi:methyltransferase (TIGR00027 family)